MNQPKPPCSDYTVMKNMPLIFGALELHYGNSHESSENTPKVGWSTAAAKDMMAFWGRLAGVDLVISGIIYTVFDC